ncbi:MAG: hypothetical protein M1837_005214 [Sclerophora amabilis]|nr:MAG: hypothetical protein M1837_005214 [Sclerophora amabilis]
MGGSVLVVLVLGGRIAPKRDCMRPAQQSHDISLAHFCEIHGPTSILCTQILPISCLTCYPPAAASASAPPRHDDSTAATSTAPDPQSSQDPSPSALGDRLERQDPPQRRPSSEPHTRHPSFSRRSQGQPVSQKSALLNQHLHQHLNNFNLANARGPPNAVSGSTPLPSPLGSPRSPATPDATQYSGSLGNTDAARRYGGGGGGPGTGAGAAGPGGIPTDTCANCSLSVPQSVSSQLPDGAPGSPTKDGKGKNGSPVLRTREAFVARGGAEDLPALDTHLPQAARRTSKKARRGSQSPKSPKTITNDKEHDGHAESSSSSDSDVFSSADPKISHPATAAASYSNPSTPPSPAAPEAHAHTLTYLSTRQPTLPDAYSFVRRSCIRTLSCEQLPRMHSGPLFFGDEAAGYTISFVFRLPDPCARGRLRRYALICWAGREERRAARAYKEVLHVFAGIASRIIEMVEKRECSDKTAPENVPTGAVAAAAGGGGGGLRGGAGAGTEVTSVRSSGHGGIERRDFTPVSSFLSGRTMDPDGYPRKSEVRAKGLAELVGKDDLFVEVHAVFVRLLAQLGRGLGGWPMGMVIDSGIRGEVGEMVDPKLEKGMRRMTVGLGDEEEVNTTASAGGSAGPKMGLDVATPATSTTTTTTTTTTPKWDSGPRQQLVV